MSKHDITVYSTPTCPYCSAAKDYFDENDIDYTDYDVSSNREKAQEMIEETGQQGVPVIQIDGEYIVGFDKDRVEEMLKN